MPMLLAVVAFTFHLKPRHVGGGGGGAASLATLTAAPACT